MFTHGTLQDMNGVSYDAEGTRKGLYGSIWGLLWVHVRADMGHVRRLLWVWNQEQYQSRPR